jgi:hypothetical protein
MPVRSILAVLLFAPALTARDDDKATPAETALVAALQSDKAFAKGEGKIARTAWVKFFEATYADQIELAFN